MSDERVDLCGFSFGGRVALAIAALNPTRIRRVVLTGVPLDRTEEGRDILRNWQNMLRNKRLEDFVWQTVRNGHSDAFLQRHKEKLKGWVDASVDLNNADAIAAIVDQTHHEDVDHPFHTLNLARKCVGMDLYLMGGGVDRISKPEEVERLAQIGRWPYTIVGGAGHAVLVEEPLRWRENVLRFLDA